MTAVEGRRLREYNVPDTCKIGIETAKVSFAVSLYTKNVPRVVSYIAGPPFNPGCHHLAIEAQYGSMRTPLRHLFDEDPFGNNCDIFTNM
ncbi:hypothetical protein PG997_011776 [Apiospora hydei]|uniref:Uncharacterized protein n=1 Tax=Apiospora hydei TaxID=1337664 RepID=A0ABR1V4N3_9PEZI